MTAGRGPHPHLVFELWTRTAVCTAAHLTSTSIEYTYNLIVDWISWQNPTTEKGTRHWTGRSDRAALKAYQTREPEPRPA